MSAVQIVRLAAPTLCAGGLVVLLAAPRRLPARPALAASLAGWLALVATLAPTTARIPLVILAALSAPVLPRVGAVVSRRPLLWFGAVGATLAIRIPVSIGGEEASLLVPLYVTILVGIGMVLARPVDERGARLPALVSYPMAALAGWLVLSSIWSSDAAEAAVHAACYVIPFSLIAWLVVALWPSDRALAWLCGGFGGVALLAAAVAIGQGLIGRTFGNAKLAELHAAGGTFRANAFLHDPNMLGRLLVVSLLMVIAAAYVAAARGRGRRVAALACAGALLTAALCLTVSQSSGLALVVGVVVLLGRAVGWRRVLIVGGLVVAATVTWGVAGGGPAHDALTSRERIARSSDGRDRLIGGGIATWRAHPVAGSGLGSFADRYRAGLSPTDRRRATLLTSHTAPVTVLAETGLVGLGLLSWLAGATILALAGRGRAPWARWVALAALGAVAAHSLLYAALLEDPLTWVALAAGMALTQRPPSRPAARPLPVRRREAVA